MKIYTYKTAKAVFINNVKTEISEEIARKIQAHFAGIANAAKTKPTTSASDSEILKVAENSSLVVKQEDGCKVEFLVYNGIVISARIWDEKNGDNDELLDLANAKFAYEDWNGFLGN